MAISSFGKTKTGDTPTPRSAPVATPAPGSSNAGGLSAFIDQGSEFEGKLSFKDTVRIDGNFRGEISSENTLIVGESGVIEASIKSNEVVISGTVMGDVTASQKIIIHKTGHVTGDLKTPSIAIEDGARFNGKLDMGRSSAQVESGGGLKALQGANESAGSGSRHPGKPADGGQKN
jgi:cytoskeletal protein CcmA (bactofilin family)